MEKGELIKDLKTVRYLLETLEHPHGQYACRMVDNLVNKLEAEVLEQSHALRTTA